MGSATSIIEKSVSTPIALLATFSAPARRAARVSGSAAAARRPAASRAMTSLHPGRPGRRVFNRMRIMSGRASATTWAPLAAATSDARSCCSQISSLARLPSRFQLSGRSAANDMSAISSIRSSGIGPMVGMNSSVVPWWSRRAPASATNSGNEARLDGTGRWSPSRWPSPSDDERPRAPPSSDASTRRPWRRLGWIRPVPGGAIAHHHAAHGRMADQEPGVDRQPDVDPVQVLGEAPHDHVPPPTSASSGIPSTAAIIACT